MKHRYRNKEKGLVVEAERLMEPNLPDEIASWCGGSICGVGDITAKVWIETSTRCGIMKSDYGGWIVKNSNGDFYTFNDKDFNSFYEEIICEN